MQDALMSPRLQHTTWWNLQVFVVRGICNGPAFATVPTIRCNWKPESLQSLAERAEIQMQLASLEDLHLQACPRARSPLCL